MPACHDVRLAIRLVKFGVGAGQLHPSTLVKSGTFGEQVIPFVVS